MGGQLTQFEKYKPPVIGQEYRLTLAREHNQNLRGLAKIHKLSPTTMAETLLLWAIETVSLDVKTAFVVTYILSNLLWL